MPNSRTVTYVKQVYPEIEIPFIKSFSGSVERNYCTLSVLFWHGWIGRLGEEHLISFSFLSDSFSLTKHLV